MTIYDELLVNGFTPDMIVSYTDQPGKPKQVTFNVSLTDEQMKIYHDLLDPERVTRLSEFISSKESIRTEFANTITRFDTFINNSSPTNAEVLSHIKLLTRIDKFILRVLRYLIFG